MSESGLTGLKDKQDFESKKILKSYTANLLSLNNRMLNNYFPYCGVLFRRKLFFFLLTCFFLFSGNIFSQVRRDSLLNQRKFAISAQAGINSMTLLYFIPMTQGISVGLNLERNLNGRYYLGFDHIRGKTLNLSEFELFYKLSTTQLYLFRNDFRIKFINQIGLSQTTFESIDYTNYLSYGDHYNAIGILLGNNNIHIDKLFPRLKFGIQTNLPVYVYGFSNYGISKYWFAIVEEGGFPFPFSFTYFTVKWMVFDSKGRESGRKLN
jgi:hypothetical protein